MLFRRRTSLTPTRAAALAGILRAPTFELVPLKNALDQAEFLPAGATVSVTASPAKGIEATVASAPNSDNNELVRDSDLALLTDALWAAGAEAISVNGERLTVLSSFRNVGIGVLVNSHPVTSPYVFDVIGDPHTLSGALNLVDGPIAQFKDADAAVNLVERDSLDITSVRQPTAPQFAQSQ